MMVASAMHNWYDKLRAEAARRFATEAWPAPTEEEWRRSDISLLGLDAYMGARGGARLSLSQPAGAGELRLSPLASPGARAIGEVSGFEVREVLERSLENGDRLARWNLAQGEAWVLELPEGFSRAEPVMLDCALSGTAAFPRLLILAGPGARAEVVYRVTSSDEVALADMAVDVELGEGSSLKLFESRESPAAALRFADTRVNIARDAGFAQLVSEIGGRFAKSRIDCALAGSGSEAVLEGIFFASRGSHLDLRTVQRHLAPRAASRALYKGALASGGRSVFQGLIEVAKEAAGTDAFLANRNLMLGDGARADSIPTLRIGNNDVRCSHGSTTGELSEAELFYLESRGFDRPSARELLVTGFFSDLLDKSPPVFARCVLARLSAATELL